MIDESNPGGKGITDPSYGTLKYEITALKRRSYLTVDAIAALKQRMTRLEETIRIVRDDLNTLIADIDYHRTGDEDPPIDAELEREAQE